VTDVRNTEPDATAHRKARFRVGWRHACDGRAYGEGALSHLTWQNLGWRLGSTFGPTSEELVEQSYEWCVLQQAESGTEMSEDCDLGPKPSM
jgi:hypothetical protein